MCPLRRNTDTARSIHTSMTNYNVIVIYEREETKDRPLLRAGDKAPNAETTQSTHTSRRIKGSKAKHENGKRP
jgi:hypothetical protein